jgi:gluconate 2-dehydrogenase gamma chain
MANSSDDPKPGDGISRREMLVRAGFVVGAAMFRIAPSEIAGQTTASAAPEGVLKTFTRLEYDTLDAICSRIIPTDETGPGAKEALAVRYIDWGLSGSITNAATLRPQYSAALAAVEAHAMSTKGMSFAKLGPADQDAIVTALQNSQVPNAPMGFFNTIRTHTIEGTFSDPFYGGNYNCAGWDLIKYPGVRSTVPAEYQQWGADLKPNHLSAYDNDMFRKGVI